MAYEPPQTLRTLRADISGFSRVPDPSLSIRSKHLRAIERNSALNSASALAAARSRRSRSAASWASRFERPRWIACFHSSTSISPEPSSSRTSRAFLRRAGCSRNCRFSSPQFLRNVMTS